MQEVTIKPKSTFIHYVTVETAGKELCWNFITKKKNISFGLSRLVVRNSTGNSQNSIDIDLLKPTNIEPKYLSTVTKNSSRASLASFDQISSFTTTKHGQMVAPPNTTPIMPIAHYESSKVTVRGSYFIKEPGTYVLIFDNSFSKNTAKKVSFFVGLRDTEEAATDAQNEFQGWFLKKGNRSMQGYRRRWVKIDSNGILTYYKGPGR